MAKGLYSGRFLINKRANINKDMARVHKCALLVIAREQLETLAFWLLRLSIPSSTNLPEPIRLC